MHFRTPLFAGHLWFLPRRHFGFSHWKQIVSRYCRSSTDIHMLTKIWFVYVSVRNHAWSPRNTASFGQLAKMDEDAWHHCLIKKHAFSNTSLCRPPLAPTKKKNRVLPGLRSIVSGSFSNMPGSESWAYRFLQANALPLLLAVDALAAPAASTQKQDEAHEPECSHVC